MAAPDISDSLRLNRIDQSARDGIAREWSVIQPELPRILTRFYKHMTQWPELRVLFANDASIERANKAQQGHWAKLFSGRFDSDYVESVHRIARVHNQIGLSPEPYVAGYLLVLEELHALVIQRYMHSFRPAESARLISNAVQAIDRAVLFDVQLVVATYLAEGEKGFTARLGELADQFDKTITGFADKVSHSAASLRANSEGLLKAVERTAEEASHAASGATESTANLQSVAAATEEMNASIAEITRQVTHTSNTASEAVEIVGRTDQIVRSLNEAADKIGQVVTLIQTIASQTNLLALNATIEAARAGEAGRGFAVVAGEVKALSAQTAQATNDIAQQVGHIQSVSKEVATSIKQIMTTVDGICEAATAISGAVEEQSAVTTEIGRSVSEAASGSEIVSHAVEGVRSVSDTTQEGARTVSQAAVSLSDDAVNLKAEAASFIVKIRTANRRAEARKDVEMDARLEIGGVTLDAKLKDVSSGGASCWLDGARLPAADRGRLFVAGSRNAIDVRVVSKSANLVNLVYLDQEQGEALLRLTMKSRSAAA
jgi:methyl-accepting chemotaxis protein